MSGDPLTTMFGPKHCALCGKNHYRNTACPTQRKMETGRSEVEQLALEIGARFRPEHNTIAFRARWVSSLAVLVRDYCSYRSSYPEQIGAWVGRIDNATDAAMASVIAEISVEIEALDNDDGWATDPAGSVLEMVCLSLMPRTRWLAHAAQAVWGQVTGSGITYNDVVKLSRDAWLQDLYRRCAA